MTSSENYYHSLLTFGMKPGLDRIAVLLRRLGDPQKSLRCIHVAGTNGKGTVCTLLAGVLTAAGYKTGLYTSPYIVNFRERIRVNGEMIPENDLDEVTLQVKEQVEAMRSEGLVITEFEAVTAAAFLYYKQCGCDFVVLETGLGGRFDATNVIERPLVSVITSISLDHVKILGNTTAEIAYEKCGIIKRNCPVVTASTQDADALRMIREQAQTKDAPFRLAQVGSCRVLADSIRGSEIYSGSREVFVPFPGSHQIENAVTALTALDELKEQGIRIPEKAIRQGFRNAKNPARCEIIAEEPLVLLDGCHNESSAKALAAVLKQYLNGKKIHALMGMMADKDIDAVLTALTPYLSSAVAVTPSNPRAMAAQELMEKIKKSGVPAVSFDSVEEGYYFALNHTKEEEVLVVCGSLYLCADVYALFRK